MKNEGNKLNKIIHLIWSGGLYGEKVSCDKNYFESFGASLLLDSV